MPEKTLNELSNEAEKRVDQEYPGAHVSRDPDMKDPRAHHEVVKGGRRSDDARDRVRTDVAEHLRQHRGR